MTLSTGTRLGSYEILSLLGEGGMGEVYRARDTRLGRDVAIKVLPAPLASDPERLKRFEREARSASALNHPNIVTIYDFGSADSISYIAMELVTGHSLRTVLLRGALPVRRLLQIGMQVAEGLAKAHAAGIVHRDLKPENIMVTEDDLVKILDFGLAKLTQPEGSGATATIAATVSTATAEGIILGTVGYMSPEQAVGGAIDYRSDQFSFGSILYELATGRRAFQRGSAPQTLASIIQDEPEPIASLSPKVPAPLRWTVQRCLAKEPRKRYASTEDLASELTTIRDNLSEASSAIGVVPPATVAASRRRWWIPATIAAAILLLAGVGGWRLQRTDYFWKNPLVGARFTRFTDWEGYKGSAAISPDGKFVAFHSDRANLSDVWVGQVGGGQFLNLTRGLVSGVFGAPTRGVGFDGDGAHVWFYVQSKTDVQSKTGDSYQIFLVPTLGGPSRLFLPRAVEAAWSPDGNQLAYYYPPGDPVFVADKNGGNSRQILSNETSIHNHYLQWSPDGRFIYFVRGIPPGDMDLWRIRATGGEPERLTSHHGRVSHPSFLDAQTLIYCAPREDGGSGLYGMNVERRIPHALTSGLEEYVSIAASADGRHLAATVANPVRNLWTVSISDHLANESDVRRFDLPTVRASDPRFGTDFILYLSSKAGAQGLWKWQGDSETELWKGSDGAVPFAPAVSADGSLIALVTRRGGRGQLTLMGSEGTSRHAIADTLDVVDVPSWSPDAKWIAVVAYDEKTKTRPLYKVPVDGGPAIRLVDGIAFDPVWSPDGQLILYSEGRGGAYHQLKGVTPDKKPIALPEIFVLYLGNRYRFMPDGKSVVIVQSPPTRQAVMQSGDYFLLDLTTGRMRQLTNLRQGFVTSSFDVSPDGKTILFDRYRENSDIVLIDLPPRS